jgi:hypothetical protein
MLYLLYGVLCVCLLGWSFLVLLMAGPRVEAVAATLRRRPLASFVMGALCCGWLFLALALSKSLGPLGGLLALITLSLLILCALLGLPAILIGLGRRASLAVGLSAPAVGLPSSAFREVALGALVLLSAGGLPWLGQLLLVGVTLWASGGAVLSLLAGGTPSPQSKEEA